MTGSPRMLNTQRHMLSQHREHSPNNLTFELSEFIKAANDDPSAGWEGC